MSEQEDSPQLPDFPDLPEGMPVNDQTFRILWGLTKALYSVVQSNIPVIQAGRTSQEAMLKTITHQHNLLKEIVQVIEEIKGPGKLTMRLDRLPPDWPTEAN